ncbi:enoyl-CoA hydratase/isomerase family protein [Phytohabitans kaempferiae]|uniref:Enoyl-CoA hydratase/isomerase family protein n=1 Tax=Phytohabitans kaempferiae TaxID=1620943 RepID=A0ABV6LY08_9ACTN
MPEHRAVTVEVADHVAWITLDDVERRNSLNPVLVAQLAAACGEVGQDPEVRVAVLRANGPVFAAGGDVHALGTPAEDPIGVYAGFRALEALPVPVVAAVHGPTIGAGVSFVLACDVAVAAESATFDPRFLDLAIHPGGGHLWKLEQRVGRQGVAALVLLGDTLTGRQAQESGLVWRCVPDGGLDAEVRRLTRKVVRRAPEVVRRAKSTMRLSRAITDPRMAAEVEQIHQEWSMRQPAFTAAVADLRARLAR